MNVFVSGAFEFAGASTTHNRLIEINPDGTLDTSFKPSINNTVAALAVSPDGDTLYVGGTFTSVNGSTAASRLVAFDMTTGLLTAFNPGVNSNVAALALTRTAGRCTPPASSRWSTARSPRIGSPRSTRRPVSLPLSTRT